MSGKPWFFGGVRLAVLVIAGWCCTVQLWADGFDLTDLGSLGGQSYALGINGQGQIVGYYCTANCSARAFVYSQGTMTDLETLGGTNTVATAINGSGQITGYAEVATGERHAFTVTNGVMQDINPSTNVESFPTAINASGQIVGSSGGHAFLYDGSYNDLGTLPDASTSLSGANAINSFGQMVGGSYNSSGNFHAFLYSGNSMLDLGTLPGASFSYSDAMGINDLGQVVGLSMAADGQDYHPFLYSNGAMSDLGFFGIAYAINNSSQVVGQIDEGAGGTNAFLYSNGTVTDINPVGWTDTVARAINDSGQIVGYGTNPDGQTHAFLLTPTSAVPEPSSLLFLTTGIAGMLALRRRSRR